MSIRSKRLENAGALILILFAALVIAWFVRLVLIDDAYITFRYAWNLAHGNGLVFNRGERVEGFSNPTWTLLTAIPIAFGCSPETFSCVVGIAFAVLAFWITYRTMREKLGVPIIPAWTALAIGIISPTFWRVMANGLEGGLYTFLLAALCWFMFARRFRAASAICGVLAWTRPEAALFIPCIAAAALFQARGKPTAEDWKRGLSAVWPGLAAVALLVALRLAYYGQLLPNTVIAKMPPSWATWLQFEYGLGYLRYFAVPHIILVLSAAVGVWLSFGQRFEKVRPAFITLCLIFLVEIVVVLRSGGDWAIDPRFLAPFVPSLAILASVALGYWKPQQGKGMQVAGFAVCLALAWLINWHVMPRSLYGTYSYSDLIRRTPGLRLEGTLETKNFAYNVLADRLLYPTPILHADDKVSSESLGLFCYELIDYYAFDFLGLTNTTISHSPPGDFVRRPERLWVQCMGRTNPAYTVQTGVSLFAFQSWLRFVKPLRNALGEQWFDARYQVLQVAGIKNWPQLILVVRRDKPYIVEGLRRRGLTLNEMALPRDP